MSKTTDRGTPSPEHSDLANFAVDCLDRLKAVSDELTAIAGDVALLTIALVSQKDSTDATETKSP